MIKYRIVYKNEWTYPFHVERRVFWFIWVYDAMFMTKAQATRYVKMVSQKGDILL